MNVNAFTSASCMGPFMWRKWGVAGVQRRRKEHGMELALAPETLARWQFGITTVYHFLFVP